MKRKEIIFSICSLLTISVLAFLCGYGFDRYLRRTLVERKRRSLSSSYRGLGPNTKDFKRDFDWCDQSWSDMDFNYPQFHDDGSRKVNTTEIDQVHQYLTEKPHLAGSQQNNHLGDYIADKWKSYGMKVYKKTYQVLLSVPKRPAVLQLFHLNGSVDYEPDMTEHPFYKEEAHEDAAPPFNAYTASGSVKAKYVYVNNGDMLDYYDLKQRNISLEGKIFITQYGSLYRGEKVRLAEEHGAVALLMFPHPEDVKTENETGYPDTWGLPEGGKPRGSINSVKGDPLTPEWPSTEGMYRIHENETSLPKIIVQPISYQIAAHLIDDMDGTDAPFGWGMNNHTKIDSSRELYLSLDVPREQHNITNIVGVLRGDTEPDRLVIMGNHRDAWVYGGGDPSSGTACMMEVSRVVGQMYDGVAGWKPRRTMVFISWDAEEYGLVGSLEWLQEHFTLMQAKTVAYINVDIGVSGDYSFRARGTPSMMDFLYQVTEKTEDPDKKDSTKEQFTNLYEHWKARYPDPARNGAPYVATPKSGSDFQGFYTMFGIPVTDVRYEYDKSIHPTYKNFPSYHTIYDNYRYYKQFVDPDTRYHKTITEVLLRQMMRITDDLILPFNLTSYAQSIQADFEALETTYGEQLANNSISLDLLKTTISKLKEATVDFHQRIKHIHKQDIYSVRKVNDQLMWFERAFIIPEGVMGTYGLKHVIYSPSQKNLFSRNSFPGLGIVLYEIDIERKTDRWDQFKIQYSLLVNCLENAIKIISKDVL
eukprot:TCONS_00031176-protein